MTSDNVPWACEGVPPEWFFPPEGRTGWRGRLVCKTCPLKPGCLERALESNEKFGIWADTNQRERQQLRPAYLRRAHDYDPDCADPACEWCTAMRAHLHIERTGPMNINGPLATCGKMSTYARGCRCPICKLRASVPGRSLAATGAEIADWWTQWFGPELDAEHDEDRLARAKVLAALDASEAA